ncbi:hypothetical protein [Cellulomonas palmilytica]|uniref:hypothetical protein n=1 Tax=Cellulomonas palmilytica TaxID=2608402 RepID=UPI001F1FCBA1|nr:hypothetical protein [Cellulomonas palmilytica]UJP40685.1 hypothetical protein F1D97_04070 [Cellulomonas palmilytica]
MTTADERTALELPDEVWREVDRETAAVLESVPRPYSCVLTGSLVDGLGNANSDIDLYVIAPDGGSGARATAIGVRDNRYVDCEYMTVGSLASLADRTVGVTPVGATALSHKDVDRFYRVAIGFRYEVDPAMADLLARFQVEVAAAAVERWATAESARWLARAHLACATGDRSTLLRFREAAIWWATARLAAAGDGYPAPKWVIEKARRTWAPGHPEAELLARFRRTRPEGVTDAIALLHEVLACPDEVVSALAAPSWSLGQGVRVVDGQDDVHLVLGRRRIVRLTPETAAACRALAASGDWSTATRHVSAQLGVPDAVARIGLVPGMRRLVASGFMTEVSDAGA